MKSISFLLLFISTVAFADQNLDSKVDQFFKSIRDAKFEMNKIYHSPAAVVRVAVCKKIDEIYSEATDLYNSAAQINTLSVRQINATTFILYKVATTRLFCSSQEGIDPNLKIYSWADIAERLDQAGSMAAILKTDFAE